MNMTFDHFESQYPETSREKEIKALLTFIQGGNSVQIVGIPGSGRTNILRFLTYSTQIRRYHLKEKSDSTHFVLVDMSEVKGRGLFEVTKYMFLCLADSLLERRYLKEYEMLSKQFKEALSYKDDLVLFQSLKQAVDYLSTEKGMSIVFLFDRFDEYIPSVSVEFFVNLRSLRDRVKYQFSCVFALTRPLEEVLEEDLLSPFYEFVGGHIVYVELLDEVSITFRLSYLEQITGNILGEKVTKELLSLTGGHGRLTRVCAECLLSHNDKNGDVSSFLLSQKTVKDALRKIWKSLTPLEQRIIKEEGKHTEHDPIESYLEKVGLIDKDSLQIPLLKEFIALDIPKKENNKILFDEQTHEIKKGESILSENLTGGEYRLLLFFIQNVERVIDREELISTVWDQNKTYAGVTDQALDQLIFRLRKKIEFDPTHPTHLQTVKGRGFKFSA